ncbi:MAG: response regulator [Alistipes sp.]|nr:response regulator [Alistipes senegalensis]MCM1250984.1 response regulator [Alistipes sp.]
MKRLLFSCCLLCFALCCRPLAAAPAPGGGTYLFDHIETPNMWINSIFQDDDGFIWLATRSGLFRDLDGYMLEQKSVFAGSHIDKVMQDGAGRLWLRRRHDVVAYDTMSDRELDERQVAELLGARDPVAMLYVDGKRNLWWIDDGALWFRAEGSSRNRLVERSAAAAGITDMYDSGRMLHALCPDGRVLRYVVDGCEVSAAEPLAAPPAADDEPFYLVFVDSAGNVWLSQRTRGVWTYFPARGRYEHFSDSSPARHIPRGFICSIIEDATGAVWMASDHGGICIWRAGAPMTYLENIPSDPSSLAGNSVFSLYRDRDDNIWVGYTKNGVSVWRGQNRRYSLLHLQSFYGRNFNDDINATCEDREGNLWFGTDGNGVVRLDRSGRETLFTAGPGPRRLHSNIITALHCDAVGRVWIGTFYGGLSCYRDGRLTTYVHSDASEGLASADVWSIDSDRAGNIWIGTLGGGLQRLDPLSGRFTTYTAANCGLANDYILQIDCCDDGSIALATAYGLSLFDPVAGRAATVLPERNGTPIDNPVLSDVRFDSDGGVWFVCEGRAGMYDRSSGKLHDLPEVDTSNVQSIVLGDDGTVWIIASDCLCGVRRVGTDTGGSPRFATRTYRFSNAAGVRFNQRSACRTADGGILAGTFNGYMRFMPGSVEGRSAGGSQRLYFTGIQVNGTSVRPGERLDGRTILDRAVEHTSEIVLRHHQNRLSVDFAALGYSSAFRRELRYRMEGISDEWIPVDNLSTRLTFFNLRPGRYRLTLETLPSGDCAGASASLAVVVRRPWYFSTVAGLSYFGLAAFVCLIAVAIFRRRRARSLEAMELAMRREQQHYVDQMKIQFFTNVSHDFRTPLTLIISPLEELLRSRPEVRNDMTVSTVYRNAQRLLTLVNQLLDLRKLEVCGIALHLAPADLATLVREVCASFGLMLQHAGIAFDVEIPDGEWCVDLDRDKVTKILTNLLSNALKFTPRGGCIRVSVSREEDFLRVSVADSGCGIPDSDKRRIFERFYQASDGAASGSGIGLHIAREFTVMHGGGIRVEDNEPQGSVFSFTLPVRRTLAAEADDADDRASALSVPASADETGQRPLLLIVDDNDEFRHFMRASLCADYGIIEAADGAEALRRVGEEPVDIVVCDVMMPVMDGVEFCRRMKSDINVSHIPVILLTARSMQEDECSGLESGADDYITKPFNMSILRLRIARFLEWKQRAHRLFDRQIDIAPDQITLTSLDDRLLQAAIEAVNDNIGNPDFSVADLSTMLHMHRTHLYKKLLFITGKAPLEFIRALRLKRAAQLLETGQTYIAEVAYMVGFNSPKLFARHFRDEFGCSPSEYQRRHAAGRSQNRTDEP